MKLIVEAHVTSLIKNIIAFSFILCILIASYSSSRSNIGVQLSNIDIDIESGSGASFGRSKVNEFTFKLRQDVNSSIKHWFYFLLRNALGEKVTFRIADYDDSLFGINLRMKPVYSYDGENWIFFENVRNTSSFFIFSQIFEEDTVWIGAAIPYTYSKLEEYLDSIEILEDVHRESLGSSSDGNSIELITITDQSISYENKQTIWITTGHHPSETSGMWVVRGIINSILSDQDLRRKYVWKINPMLNPDGVVDGYTRYDSDGFDLNREWDDEMEMEPEISSVYSAIVKFLKYDSIDLIADFHSSGHYHPYVIVLPEDYSYSDYNEKLVLLIETIQEYTDYDGVVMTSTQGTIRVESFDLWDIPSVTLEIPVNSLTNEYCMEQGAHIAKAFDSFLSK